jgi:hypothetical protein
VGNWKMVEDMNMKDMNIVGFYFGEKITKIDSGLHPYSWTISANFVFKAIEWHSIC